VECEGSKPGTWDICFEDDGSDEVDVNSARLKPAPRQIGTEELNGRGRGEFKVSHFLRNAQGVASHHGRLSESVRVVVISDTHGLHREVMPPPGDILVHGGDFSNTGEPEQVSDLAEWLGALPHKEKVVIAGNHDITFDKEYYVDRGKDRFHPNLQQPHDVDEVRNKLISSSSCRYVEDAVVNVCDITTYGSPWQPEFCDWAFNLQRGEECYKMWKLIPSETDILITHGPPHGHGDMTSTGEYCGCVDLMKRIGDVKPRLHLFGHVHEGYGCTTNGKTLFVNASNCDNNYRTSQLPIVIDLPMDRTLPPSVCQPSAATWTLADIKRWYPTSLIFYSSFSTE
jgi:predicted phosphohydrolase